VSPSSTLGLGEISPQLVEFLCVFASPPSRMKYASGFIDRKSPFWSKLSNVGDSWEAQKHNKIGG